MKLYKYKTFPDVRSFIRYLKGDIKLTPVLYFNDHIESGGQNDFGSFRGKLKTELTTLKEHVDISDEVSEGIIESQKNFLEKIYNDTIKQVSNLDYNFPCFNSVYQKQEYVKDNSLFLLSCFTLLFKITRYTTCFTENSIDDFNNHRMWEYYAHSYGSAFGVGLEYNFSEEELSKYLKKVEYTNEKPNFATQNYYDIITQSCYKKSTKWSDEKEWRVVMKEKINLDEKNVIFDINKKPIKIKFHPTCFVEPRIKSKLEYILQYFGYQI